jgi:hypothetical protein
MLSYEIVCKASTFQILLYVVFCMIQRNTVNVSNQQFNIAARM